MQLVTRTSFWQMYGKDAVCVAADRFKSLDPVYQLLLSAQVDGTITSKRVHSYSLKVSTSSSRRRRRRRGRRMFTLRRISGGCILLLLLLLLLLPLQSSSLAMVRVRVEVSNHHLTVLLLMGAHRQQRNYSSRQWIIGEISSLIAPYHGSHLFVRPLRLLLIPSTGK